METINKKTLRERDICTKIHYSCYCPGGVEPVQPDTGRSDFHKRSCDGDSVKRSKFVVNDVPVKVVAERVQYYGKDGKLITESLKDYTRNKVRKEYESLDSFLTRWSKAGKKNLILQELEGQGLLLDALAEQVGRDYDPFDLICHVVYDKPPL